MAYHRPARPVLNLVADDVWAAACAAQRMNGSYIKAGNAEGKESNRAVIDQLLSDASPVTDADRKAAEATRKYFKGLTFKILKGIQLSEFDNTAMTIANRDTITSSYDVAVIASLPSCFERGQKRDQTANRIDQARGGFVGKVGDKVTLTIEVLRSIYSVQWGTNYVTGITEDDQVVFFSFKEAMTLGSTVKVFGTVKAHRDNSTQLNRVKVI